MRGVVIPKEFMSVVKVGSYISEQIRICMVYFSTIILEIFTSASYNFGVN